MEGPYFFKLLLFLSFRSTNTINHFLRLCGQPKATELFFYRATFFEKVKKILELWCFLFFDVLNAKDQATSFLNLVPALLHNLSSPKKGRGHTHFLIQTLSIHPI